MGASMHGISANASSILSPYVRGISDRQTYAHRIPGWLMSGCCLELVFGHKWLCIGVKEWLGLINDIQFWSSRISYRFLAQNSCK